MHRRTDTQTPYKTNESTHYPLQVQAEIFLYPIFSSSHYLSQLVQINSFLR